MRSIRKLAIAAAVLVMGPSTLQAQSASVTTVVDTLIGGVGGVAVDGLGIIYVATFGETVYKVWPDGRYELFATGLYGSSGNTIDSHGNLVQSNFTGGYLTRIDRHGNQEIWADGLRGPVGVWVTAGDTAFVNDCPANAVMRVTPEGVVEPFSESPLFACPNGITQGPDSSLYVINFSDGVVIRVAPDGEASQFAVVPGGGGGHITVARGRFYATSFRGQAIYEITTDGEVSLYAGVGTPGELDGAANQAAFTFPNGIATGRVGDRLFVNDFINRFPPTLETPPVPLSSLRQIKLPDLSTLMIAALRSGGVEAMAEAHREWKSDPSTAGTFTEIEVNAVGYGLMQSGNLPAAIKAFELNAEAYPNSFNVWDSLAEGHMNAGNTDLAIEYYEKSLELNPGNQNAIDMLEEIK